MSFEIPTYTYEEINGFFPKDDVFPKSGQTGSNFIYNITDKITTSSTKIDERIPLNIDFFQYSIVIKQNEYIRITENPTKIVFPSSFAFDDPFTISDEKKTIIDNVKKDLNNIYKNCLFKINIFKSLDKILDSKVNKGDPRPPTRDNPNYTYEQINGNFPGEGMTGFYFNVKERKAIQIQQIDTSIYKPVYTGYGYLIYFDYYLNDQKNKPIAHVIEGFIKPSIQLLNLNEGPQDKIIYSELVDIVKKIKIDLKKIYGGHDYKQVDFFLNKDLENILEKNLPQVPKVPQNYNSLIYIIIVVIVIVILVIIGYNLKKKKWMIANTDFHNTT